MSCMNSSMVLICMSRNQHVHLYQKSSCSPELLKGKNSEVNLTHSRAFLVKIAWMEAVLPAELRSVGDIITLCKYLHSAIGVQDKWLKTKITFPEEPEYLRSAIGLQEKELAWIVGSSIDLCSIVNSSDRLSPAKWTNLVSQLTVAQCPRTVASLTCGRRSLLVGLAAERTAYDLLEIHICTNIAIWKRK
jgi:hypothetical protein